MHAYSGSHNEHGECALSRITEQNYKTIDSVSQRRSPFFICFIVNFPFYFYLYEEKALCLFAHFFSSLFFSWFCNDYVKKRLDLILFNALQPPIIKRNVFRACTRRDNIVCPVYGPRLTRQMQHIRISQMVASDANDLLRSFPFCERRYVVPGHFTVAMRF